MPETRPMQTRPLDTHLPERHPLRPMETRLPEHPPETRPDSEPGGVIDVVIGWLKQLQI